MSDQDEVVDPVISIRAECVQKSDIKQFGNRLEECNRRVRSRPGTQEKCDEEMVDFAEKVAHCVSHSEPQFRVLDSCDYSETQTFRDRSAEFGDIIKIITKETVNSASNLNGRSTGEESYSPFEISASKITLNLSRSRQKLDKLNLLTKRSFTFESQTSEIQHLISIIKQDMANLNCHIMDLQKLDITKDGHYPNKSECQHSKAIVLGLQAELANITNAFKSILELRNSSVQEKAERRSKIAGVRNDSQVLHAPQNSFLIKQDAMHRQRFQCTDDPNSQQSRDAEVTIHMNEMQSEQLVAKNSFIEERTEAMRNVEETIVQLGEVFQQLAVMVHEQGEMVQRIDANIEEAHFNLEAATLELKKYFRSISSNRWLMIKIFSLLFIFLIIFIVFFL